MTLIESLVVFEIANVEELDTIIIGFRNEDHSKSFMIQQGLAELNVDEESYYADLNEQGFGGYGLINRIEFGSKKIEIFFNEKGKLRIQKEKLILHLEESLQEMDSLKLTFSKIFSKSKKFRVVKN